MYNAEKEAGKEKYPSRAEHQAAPDGTYTYMHTYFSSVLRMFVCPCSVVDLTHNRLEDPAVQYVLTAMPELVCTTLQHLSSSALKLKVTTHCPCV